MGERSSAGRRARDSSVANAITGCAPDRGRKESSAPRSPDGRRWTGACAWRRWRRSPPARRKRGSRPACTTANYLGTPLRWIGCQSSRLGRIPRATATTRWHRRDQCPKQPLLLGDGTTLRRHAHRPQALLLPGPGPLANWPARAPPAGAEWVGCELPGLRTSIPTPRLVRCGFRTVDAKRVHRTQRRREGEAHALLGVVIHANCYV